MKRFILITFLALTAISASAEDALPAKWKLTKSSAQKFEAAWLADGHKASSTECGSVYMTVTQARKNRGNELKHSIYKSQMPRVEGLLEGDCLVFVIPAGEKAVGPYVELDLMIGSRPDAPRYYAVEYFDRGKWRQSLSGLRTAPEDSRIRYNVKFSGRDNEPADILQTLRFSKPVKGDVQIRLRAVGDIACSGKKLAAGSEDSGVRLLSYGYISGYVADYGAAAPKDTTKVLWLGNSFTFVNAADFMLKELAWNEGHYLDMWVSTYPGARFRNHLALGTSLDAITEGGFDFAILQDQSQQAARYGRDSTASIKEHTKTLSSVIRYFSPDCKFVYEQTWAFAADDFGGFGSFEEFDRCADKGAAVLAEVAEGKVSPIAKAFAIIRAERPDIDPYSTDFHHPADYGAYVKACVDYLVMFHEPFGDNPATFALDPAIAAYLRSVAERVVL
ncbi:MAG: hypothetical protein KBT00_01495 [Bacteroidales bacterium]|nr:hypothetical protein [Candidatus Cacconaster merdequi]